MDSEPQFNQWRSMENVYRQNSLRASRLSLVGGAGHVSPMAVMVAPNRIDYSVTKGGLRTWVVLFVFIFLCSGLYTIFSARDLTQLAVDMDEDGVVDIDEEIESDADEVANQYRRAEKDRTPSRDNIVQATEEIKRVHQKTRMTTATADDDLDEEDEPSEEETLLAGLRAKMEEKKRKQSETGDGDDDEGREEEETQKQPTRTARRRRRRKGSEDGEDGSTSDEGITSNAPRKESKRKVKGKETTHEDERIDEIKPQPHGKRQWKRREKAAKLETDVEAEENQEEEEEKDYEKDEKFDEDQSAEENKEEGEDQGEPEGNVQETETEKEKEKEKHEEKGEGEGISAARKSGVKKKKRVVPNAEQLQMICKRKNCPPAYDHVPRMELLKQKPQSTLSHRNKRYMMKPTEEEDLIDFDEFEDDEEDGEQNIEDEDEQLEDVNEIAAIKKGSLNARAAYKRRAITNRDDHRFRDQLDKADYLVEKHDYRGAFAIFDNILRHNPDSPRAHFGKARAFDIRSEMDADKAFLDMAINEYQEVLDCDDTPDALFRQAANRLIDRARFRGAHHKALIAQRSLIDRYPDEIQLQNDFALTFLMMGRQDDARKLFEDVLRIDPNNGIAQAYYGYLIKLEGELEQGVIFMRKGLRTARAAIADPRFYYHLGDALSRLGRKQEAYEVYSVGAKIGLFLSPYQRSLYNYYGLTARPWWSLEQTTYARHLKNVERQWTIIREEALRVLETNPTLYITENEHLTIGGQWLAYNLYYGGIWNNSNCRRTPKTCDILAEFKESSNGSKSQMKISLLTSGTRIWPHCGYSNCRLQAQMGLVVPSEARIRVADETRGWKTGRFIIFDDSFEHELWFEGASANKMRLVLVLDLWHPEIDSARRYEFDGDF
uniref:Aspartyl/asparaginy/proline hydroxylase domain-containing protein n=1 Tax=Parascaris univalens TaxID=6257 RepID=A0A915BAZ3_PARUN